MVCRLKKIPRAAERSHRRTGGAGGHRRAGELQGRSNGRTGGQRGGAHERTETLGAEVMEKSE